MPRRRLEPHSERRPRFAGDTPACCTTKQFVYWLGDSVTLKRHGLNSIADQFCNECLPSYQAAMIRERRCENPQVTFGPDKDPIAVIDAPRSPERVGEAGWARADNRGAGGAKRAPLEESGEEAMV